MKYSKKHDTHNKDLHEERDYTCMLADALAALKNVPEGECSEEVQETINAAIEDISDFLTWFRYGDQF